MFKKILVANRGEIAIRIIRACRDMGIDTVAVYSTADETALHAKFATESVCIGPAKAKDSYLNMKNILTAATELGCEAIHPGFGFLSENSEFARLCERSGIKFIGPSGDVMDKMGNKSVARRIMRENNVPVVPGSEGTIKSVSEAERIADKIGYPVLIKASAGGGGRGMRRVASKEEISQAYMSAKAEAKACFDDDEMYLEKLIINPKHIEFQILGDQQGNIIHLGERDCSMQRRNQKMVEEAPAKCISAELRTKMGEAAIKAGVASGYQSAGTVEFVLDKNNNFYFIEMNTRIQVEHTITEMITGVDIVKEQIRIAAGLPLDIKQEDVVINGHAIECRINAEDPQEDFRPCPGTIEFVHFSQGKGVRIDSAIYNGYVTNPFYDSMIAKIIVHGKTRLEAVRRMRRALEETLIEGIYTNQSFQHLLMFHPEFLKGTYNTGFIEHNTENILQIAEITRTIGECYDNPFDRRKAELNYQETLLNKNKTVEKKEVEETLFEGCPSCGKTFSEISLLDSMYVCPDCDYHFKISAEYRIELLLDKGSFKELNENVVGINPLEFPEYDDKIKNLQEKTGMKEGVVTGIGKINGINLVLAVLDSRFMMGSMGTAVGEKITLAIEYATKFRLPIVIFCASGGARMQEGIFSLMQMSKTSAALEKHKKAKLLYIAVLTNPTTGGVTASFGSLGDIILAEPKALIGFAGPRVIEQTIKQKLPEGFQSSEYLKDHGFIDNIVSRNKMKQVIYLLLKVHEKEWQL